MVIAAGSVISDPRIGANDGQRADADTGVGKAPIAHITQMADPPLRRAPASGWLAGARPHRMLPGLGHGLAEGGFIHCPETDHRRAAASPGAAGRLEDIWIGTDEFLLRLRRQLHHAPHPVLMESRKDASVDAEVGVSHVSPLDSVFQPQCHPPEGCLMFR
jgi:hypothetical protein